MFSLVKSEPTQLPRFFAIALPLCTASIVAWALYIGRTFARNSPACPSCGRHVRMLQRRRVFTNGKCTYCNGQIFAA
jgi:hypothetical protein